MLQNNSRSEKVACFLCDWWGLLLLVLFSGILVFATRDVWLPWLGTPSEPTPVVTPVQMPTDTPADFTASPTITSTATRTVEPTPVEIPGPVVGLVAPDFSLKTQSGLKVSLSDSRGKPVLLFFFATWCPYCQQEAPIIQSMYLKYKANGLTVIPIVTSVRDLSKLDADLKTFVANAGWTEFNPMIDTDGSVSNLYQQTGIPSNFFIDKKGVIRFTSTGLLDAATMESAITKILANP